MEAESVNWVKSQDFESALKRVSEGLEELFPNPNRKAHLMHNADGHPWIRLIQPMNEIRFVGVTPSRGTGPSYLKLRVFVYAEHHDSFQRLLDGKRFTFEGRALSRGRAYPWGSWERDLAREGRTVEGYEATLKTEDWSSVNAESRLRFLIEEFCRFVQAGVKGGAAYDALPEVRMPEQPPPWTEDQEAVEEIERRGDLSESEREALVKLRIGQGWFRKQLVERWNGCAVTRCTMTHFLVASHIVPWSSCGSTSERWSADNGLLLTPNLDKLFDRGLIGFEDSGSIILGPNLPRGQMHHFGVDKNMRLSRDVVARFKNLAGYLSRHREENGLSPATP